jgi:hypothetical protein
MMAFDVLRMGVSDMRMARVVKNSVTAVHFANEDSQAVNVLPDNVI